MTAGYNEEEYLQLSALQHFLFCKRQCALIHLEQIWVENRFTAEGRDMHERVDRGDQVDRGKIRIEYGLPLKSRALGLTGKADVVEFHLDMTDKTRWIPFPVEYKRGKPKKDDSDKVQLCAQAICLEEMLGIPVKKGALFYGKTRRRLDVKFDLSLRDIVQKTSDAFHEMMISGVTPPPRYEKKCDTCSFFSVCMPKTIGKKRNVAAWLKQIVQMDGSQEAELNEKTS